MKLKLDEKKNRRESSRNGNEGIRSKRGRNLLLFVAFLLLSSVFWLMRSLQENYKMRISVPVQYNELPASIGVSSDLPKSIEVDISDKGIRLLRYSLSSFEPIQIRATKQQLNRERLSISRQSLAELLRQQLEQSTQIVRIVPEEINISFYKKQKLVLPVKLLSKLEAEGGFYVSDPAISPTRVAVYGSRENLDKLKEILTDTLKRSALRESFVDTISLGKYPGLVFEPKFVTVQVDVEELTEQHFELDLKTVNVPVGELLRPLPSRVDLQLTIPRSRYNEIKAEDLELSVFYPLSRDSLANQGALEVVLTKKPDWLKHYKIVPSRVQYIVEKSNR